MLITGYLYHNRNVNYKRIFLLVCEVWFYSVVLGGICLSMGWRDFSIKTLIKMVFPIIYNEYPFFSAYIVLYCLIPYLNNLIHSVKRGELLIFIGILMLAISIIPTVFNSSWILTETQLPAFILLYVIGAGLGKYGNELLLKHHKFALPGFALMVLFMWVSQIVLQIVLKKHSLYFAWDMNKIPAVIASVFVFMVFKDLQIGKKRSRFNEMVTLFSGAVFGVYLIHMNRGFKTVLLDSWFDNTSTYGTWKLFPQALGGALLIFIVCAAVDIIRSKTIGKVLDRPAEWVSGRVENAACKINAKENT